MIEGLKKQILKISSALLPFAIAETLYVWPFNFTPFFGSTPRTAEARSLFFLTETVNKKNKLNTRIGFLLLCASSVGAYASS